MIDTKELPGSGMMAKVSVHRGSGARPNPQSSRQTLPELSAFAKLLRQHIGNWGKVSDNTLTPPTQTTATFREEFGKLAVARGPNIATPTADTVANWWQGKTRPHWKDFQVIVDVLLDGGEKHPRYGALKAAWIAADVKAAGRQDKAPAEDFPDEAGTRSAPRYETRFLLPDSEPSPVVGMEVDFVGFGQGMVEGGLPVVLSLNWAYVEFPDVGCRVYLKEFRLIARPENCGVVPKSFYEGQKTPALEVQRNGRYMWEFSAGKDHRLAGKFPDIDCLFTVKPALNPHGLPTVKVEGYCPSDAAENFDVVWRKDKPSEPDLTAAQEAVIGRFLATCLGSTGTSTTEGAPERTGTGRIEFGWAGVSLVKSEP